MENTQNETHFLRFPDKSEYEQQYKELAGKTGVRMETAPTEYHDDLMYSFYGSQELISQMVSNTGHDEEDYLDVIEVGEIKNL